MQTERRETILKIAVGVVVGLFVLDRMVLSPVIARWKEQGERVAALKQQVQRGRELIERESSIRGRWADMQRTDLPDDRPQAESEIYKGMARWATGSRINFSNINPQWRDHADEGYDTYECRASATGDQASIARLLYELETDPLPAHLQECEISAKDAGGKQLNLNLRFSFIRLNAGGKGIP